MAHVLQMNARGMPYAAGSPADGKDAYIGWLRSEFAAANAIIDSMCQHVQSMGSPGDYDTVFSCLNRRRQTWTPTLYMQQFSSVDEFVNSLQQVAHKKELSRCVLLPAGVESGEQPSWCQAQPSEPSTRPPVKKVDDRTKEPRCQQQPTRDLYQTPQRTPGVAVPPNSALKEAVDAKGSNFSTERFTGTAESNVIPKTGDIAPSEHDMAGSANGSFIVSEGDKAESGLDQDVTEGRLAELKVNRLLSIEVPIAPNEEEARHALIKRSVQFQCCELVDGQTINDGESVELCESVFNSDEVGELINVVSQLQAAGRKGELGCAFSRSKKPGNKPDVIRFGPKYQDGIKANHSLRMPKSFKSIIRWLTLCGIVSAKRKPDSCLISIFDEGDFESPNADQVAWERPLCVISLLGECTMVFGHVITSDQQGSCKGSFQVALPIGSVLLLKEKFAGILQKAVPASPSRRIMIALGKAMSNSNAGLSYMNPEGKARMKQWWGTTAENGCYPDVPNGALKPARFVGGITMDLVSDMLPHHPNGPQLARNQPIFPFADSMCQVSPFNPHSTVFQGWSYMPANLQSSGTGVFLPLTETTEQSGLFVSLASGLQVHRTGQTKRTEKHGKLRGSFDSVALSQGKTINLSPPDGIGCGVNSTTSLETASTRIIRS